MKEPTEREKLLVQKLMDNPKLSQTQAYMQIYPTNNRKAASVEASRHLAKPSVAIYKENIINRAKKSVAELSKKAKSEDVKLRASQDILDRSHGKPKTTVDITSKVVTVSLDLTGSDTQLQAE